MTAEVVYCGNLRTQMTHIASGTRIESDAPTDNHGKGERFSPTDLCAVSLASCMLTIMGIKVEGADAYLSDAITTVKKVMANNPRRIIEIRIVIQLKREIPDQTYQRFQEIARTCPVAQSLHPDIVQDVNILRNA